VKTQSIFQYAVTENINVKDAKSGQIEKIEKKILGSGIIAAYDEKNAGVQAQKLAKIPATVDMSEVEVVVRPFCVQYEE